MRLDGRRTSTHVDDRRGRSSGRRGMAIGGGIVGIIIAAVATWLSGGNPIDVLSGALGNTGFESQQQTYTPTAEEEELADFSKKIFAGTEDVWTKLFAEQGRTYEPPTLVLYTGATTSGCGNADASIGPFYCSADETVYIDLSFFSDMRRTIGADGDFAYAYVIAHEVGHHVQHLLGQLAQSHDKMQRSSQTESNHESVRLELQADYYAGVWAHHDNLMFGSLEPGDIEEALDAAQKIGDDYLQKRAQGYAVPDSFNHGTSAQRERWLRKGLDTGTIAAGDTFSPSYSSL
ncbi:MAG: zinc metallopeptidase [Paramuribaculum sp.]|nr:zinc metallopeptidase [Paramuribaculum sp.]